MSSVFLQLFSPFLAALQVQGGRAAKSWGGAQFSLASPGGPILQQNDEWSVAEFSEPSARRRAFRVVPDFVWRSAVTGMDLVDLAGGGQASPTPLRPSAPSRSHQKLGTPPTAILMLPLSPACPRHFAMFSPFVISELDHSGILDLFCSN